MSPFLTPVESRGNCPEGTQERKASTRVLASGEQRAVSRPRGRMKSRPQPFHGQRSRVDGAPQIIILITAVIAAVFPIGCCCFRSCLELRG